MTVQQTTDHTGLAISLRNLSVTFASRDGSAIQALEPVDLDLHASEFVTIVGPSGCGKSTILKVLAGLNTNYDGAATIDGDRVDEPRSDVGVMFQSPVLLPWRTALDNVLLPSQIGRKATKHRRREALDMLALAGLAGFEEKYPWELSGGMQQRVALSRSLVGNPRLLLMDEPFGAVDEFTREHLNLELLRMWAQLGATVVLVTHSVDEAVLLSDRVVLMSSRPGRVVGIETINLPRPRRLDMVGSAEFAKHVTAIRESLGVNR
jgi:NitT/TauT family transport system ATP-binding protein